VILSRHAVPLRAARRCPSPSAGPTTMATNLEADERYNNVVEEIPDLSDLAG